ncbi:MAG: hypothetical protein GXX09_07685 [Syntrophomonadaceae bacterium]|nr:hypothetical protein [Syntrophomonadaceae bacterium]
MARIKLRPNKKVIAEPEAVIAMTPQIRGKAKFARGGVLKSLARSIMGSKSFFTTTCTAYGDAELIMGSGCPVMCGASL